jgi:flagellar biosynthesis protein
MDETERPALAIALRYGTGDRAPVVTAKGRNEAAAEIVRRAREAGVPIHQSALLAEMLIPNELDTPIPPQLYRLVAEVLAWIYQVERQHGSPAARLGAPPRS